MTCGKPFSNLLATEVGQFSHLLFLKADFQKPHLSKFSPVAQSEYRHIWVICNQTEQCILCQINWITRIYERRFRSLWTGVRLRVSNKRKLQIEQEENYLCSQLTEMEMGRLLTFHELSLLCCCFEHSDEKNRHFLCLGVHRYEIYIHISISIAINICINLYLFQ